MLERCWSFVLSYLEFYRDFVVGQWYDMTPIKYGILLILIGVFGWILMKNGPKRV